MTENEEIHLREEYKKALKMNKKLAVSANKFKKSKFLLLYTVPEKNESHITKDDN